MGCHLCPVQLVFFLWIIHITSASLSVIGAFRFADAKHHATQTARPDQVVSISVSVLDMSFT